jgi:hypothetical protein
MFNRRSKCASMKRLGFPAGLIALIMICLHGAAGQTNLPAAQNSARVATNGNTRASNARPNGPISRNVRGGAVGVGPRTAYSRPTQIGAQPPVNSRSNYSVPGRSVSPTLAAMSAPQSARPNNVEPVADLLARNDVGQTTVPLTDAQRIPTSYDFQPTRNVRGRENMTRSDPPTADVSTGDKIPRPRSDELPPRETPQRKPPHNRQGNKHQPNFSDACRRHRHEWHDGNWWKQNCTTIVFVNTGYYFLDAGYWYPAWGYDPLYSYYDYDGPIYTYGNLLPDEVIANVQVALKEAGYYFGPITGSLSVETRAALVNFQRDYGLIVTGAIDQPTIEALGLY